MAVYLGIEVDKMEIEEVAEMECMDIVVAEGLLLDMVVDKMVLGLGLELDIMVGNT